jgi:ATP dependent DNA ligase domain
MRGSIWPFQFGSPRDIEQAEAKTTKDQTIQKRAEPAFIEPMQCKPVSALPSGEKWTFEIKFDGYRCIAVKRGKEVTLFSRNQKVLNKRFPKVVEALASPDEGDFVLDWELVAIDSQGRPSFQLLQNNLSRALPVYFYPFDLLNRDGELLVTCRLNVVASCWGGCFPSPKTRCAYRRCCGRHRDKFLRRYAGSVLKESSAKGLAPYTNLASDQARGSSTARIESRISFWRLHSRCAWV